MAHRGGGGGDGFRDAGGFRGPPEVAFGGRPVVDVVSRPVIIDPLLAPAPIVVGGPVPWHRGYVTWIGGGGWVWIALAALLLVILISSAAAQRSA